MKALIQYDSSYYKYPTASLRLNHDGIAYIGGNGFEMIRSSSLSKYIKEKVDIEYLFDFFMDFSKLHGVFAGEFFERKLRTSLLKDLLIQVQEIQDLTKDQTGYGLEVRNRSDAIFRLSQFIQILILEKFNSDIFPIIRSWYNTYEKKRCCKICGKPYRVIDLPYWIYFGSNGFKDCCFSCEIIEKPHKEDLKIIIKEFIDVCGFIPNSNLSPREYAFMSRIDENRIIEALRLYGRMGGIDHVKRKFKSWFEALVYSGAFPNGVQALSRGVRCIAKDGHVCNSLEELYVDNWLHANRIPHDKEPLYPFDEDFNISGKRRADWLINNVFIEYFGLNGDEKYDKKTDEKYSLSKKKGFELIGVFPESLNNLTPIFQRFK